MEFLQPPSPESPPSNGRHTTAKSRLLVGCNDLETDVSRFHYRRNRGNGMEPGDTTCKLCHSEPEDPSHFILHCPSLTSHYHELTPISLRPDPTRLPSFAHVICSFLHFSISSFLLSSFPIPGFRPTHLLHSKRATFGFTTFTHQMDCKEHQRKE